MPNRSRQKGDRFERALVHRFTAAGIGAHRVPLSGAVDGYPGDVLLDGYAPPIIVQCKHFADSFKRLFLIADARPVSLIIDAPGGRSFVLFRDGAFFEWLSSPSQLSPNSVVEVTPLTVVARYLEREDVLFVKRDRGAPFVVVTLEAAARIIREERAPCDQSSSESQRQSSVKTKGSRRSR